MTAADLGRREPARARDAGLICGQVHARLAGVSAPAELRAVPGAPASAARQPGGQGRVAAGGLSDVPARACAWACDAGVVDGESGGWHGLPNSPLASLMAGAPLTWRR